MSRLTTLYIDKEAHKFSAAHYTIFSASDRERLHGHNYSVSARIVADMSAVTSGGAAAASSRRAGPDGGRGESAPTFALSGPDRGPVPDNESRIPFPQLPLSLCSTSSGRRGESPWRAS